MITIATWEIATNDCPNMSISLSIYCAGCQRGCPGCQNPALQDFKNGVFMDTDQVVAIVTERRSLIESVVFLGGDWMHYPKELKGVSSQLKTLYSNLILILYTGESIEYISESILENLDIIIDGPYDENKITKYAIPASSNQRVFLRSLSAGLFEVEPSTLPINKEQ